MLTSKQNPRIKRAISLAKAHPSEALFLIENTHLIAEAARLNLIVDLFTIDARLAGTLISAQLMRLISDMPSLPAQVAVAQKLAPGPLTGSRILALDYVQDPGNVGTLIRTAVAFNFDAVVVRGANVYSPKVVRAAQGAHFQIKLYQVNDLRSLLANYFLLGADVASEATPLSLVLKVLPPRFVLVLGSEGQGISPELREHLNLQVRIPVHFESLNVASAGAILMHALALVS